MKTVPLVATALVLSASTAHAAAPVTAELLGIQDVRIGLSGAQFTLRTSLTRTRGLPIVVKGVSYRLLVNGEVVGMGEQDDNVRLRRNKPAELLIPSTFSPRGGIAAMAVMAGDPEIEITYVGEATGRWLFFSRTETFTDTISTEELFSAFMPR